MPLNLDHIEALARAATPGPWRLGDEHPLILRDADDYYVCTASTPSREPDMRFIASCDPSTILRLIAVARAAVALRKQDIENADLRDSSQRIAMDEFIAAVDALTGAQP